MVAYRVALVRMSICPYVPKIVSDLILENYLFLTILCLVGKLWNSTVLNIYNTAVERFSIFETDQTYERYFVYTCDFLHCIFVL